MDSYAEQIVRKSDGGADSAKRAILLVGGVFLGLAVAVLGSIFGAFAVSSLIGVGILYGGIYLSANYDIEYEYLIVNGSIDIDKIMSKKRRKPLISVSVSQFESFGIYDAEKGTPSDMTIVSAEGDSKENQRYYADFSHETYGKCRLIFTPDNNILREIKPYLKGQIRQVLNDLPEKEKY